MRLPNLPADRKIADGDGQLTDGFWLFLGNIARWIRANGNSIQLKQSTQAKLTALAATLTKADAGLLVEVTDYAHVLRWTGTGWEWGPGEEGGGYFREFAIAPVTAGWQACDGTAGIAYLKSDGTTGTITVPNTAAGAYVKLGAAYASAITAATVPTSSTPTFAGALGTTSGPSAAALIGTGAASGATSTHTHTFTPAGTVSTPTIALPADPVAHFGAILYFRQ